jgi:acyl carrier protein
MTADPHILAEVLAMIDELAGDWEYDGEVTPDTYFLADMGLESLDLVVLGTMIQQRYGRLPFAEYLAEIGQRPVQERDVTIAELVAFIAARRAVVSAGGARP